MNGSDVIKASRREQLSELWQTLQSWPWLDTLRTLRQRFREDRLGLTASSLTFTTTIAIVPLVTVALALFSAFPVFARFQGALEQVLLQSLVPDSIARPVLGALTQFAAQANQLGTLGLVVLVLTALALMLTIDRTLNNIWRVRAPRPLAQRLLVYWAAATLGPLVLGVSLTLTSYAISSSRGVVDTLPGGVSLLLNAIEFLAFSGGVAALFHFVPNTHVRWRHAWAGGVFVYLGFEVAKKALGWYLAQVGGFTLIYGAFATLPIFLLWIYLGWVIVLLGAVIAAYAPSLQLRVVRRAEVPGYRLQLAVQLLRELEAARGQPRRGASVEELAQALRADPLQIEPVLETLIAIDWIGRLDEGDVARYVMLCDAAVTKAEPLLTQLVAQPSLALAPFRRSARFDQMTLRDLLD